MPHRPRWRIAAAAAAVIAAAAAAPAPARADELLSTLDQALDEVSHTVDVRIADGVATYVVQRQFKNRGKLADEARLAIELPTGAAATGLRIRASGAWHAGELLDREQAAARYRELTGAGVHDPKDPALLFWISPNQLYLQVFPVMPNAVSTVEYTLTVPTRYAAGRYWLTYPRVDPARAKERPGALKLVDPVLTIRAPAGLAPGAAAAIVVDGKPTAADRPVTLASFPPAPAHFAGSDEGSSAILTASAVEVPASPRTERRFTDVKLAVDLQHASLSDLRLELLTPAGERVVVADGGGGQLAPRAAFDVSLPAAARGAGRWRLLASSSSTAHTGTLARWTLTLGDQTFASADTPVFIPAAAEPAGLASFTVAPPPIATWSGRLARVVASSAHAFTRLELDAAPRLSELPKAAQVVFVVDASHSAVALLDAQLAILRAYVSHVPDAELEVIAVRRTARRVFGRFVPARDAERLLAEAARTGALAPGNGSALDEGAKLAASILAGRPGPHRVVLATDELLRPSLGGGAALASLAALAPAAVVHVVVPSPSVTGGNPVRPSLARDDAAPLALLAGSHHGIFARVSDVGGSPLDLAPVVLELVRPTRIDHLTATGGLTVGDTLSEGEGLRIFEGGRTAAAAPAKLTLTGSLWSDPIRLDLAESAPFTTASAGFVFATDLYSELSEAEQRTVALAGRAVSPVTSYLAIEPGVRPSKIGLDGGGTGWGTIGLGRYGTIGHGSGEGMRMPPDLQSLISPAACLRTYPPTARPWEVQIAVETTRDEIVDVTVRRGPGPLAACLVEAVWAVRLHANFDRDRDSFVLTFGGM